MPVNLDTLEVDADDEPVATLVQGDWSWHDGPGWYYIDGEYPDEGSCGAFSTREEAIQHAQAAGYRVDCATMNTDPEEKKPEETPETPMTEEMPTGTPVETPASEPAPLTEEMPPEETPPAA